MEKTKQRISWIDVTKGIAIYLVILGHSLIGLKVNDYIFAFHMPLFFIASGLLFREKSIKIFLLGFFSIDSFTDRYQYAVLLFQFFLHIIKKTFH